MPTPSGAGEQAQEEAERDRDHVDDHHPFEAQRVCRVQERGTRCRIADQLDADHAANAKAASARRTDIETDAAERDPAGGNGPVALQRVRAVGVAIDPVVADIHRARKQAEGDKRGRDLCRKHAAHATRDQTGSPPIRRRS